MRLWHKDLIPYLPRQQLIAQWRECCAIASNIANKGTPNHLLVNRIMKYPLEDFYIYTTKIVNEFHKRIYKIGEKSLTNFTLNQMNFNLYKANQNITKNIFPDWHNERYLKQCIYNLQEKYDCGGISESEWKVIAIHFYKYL